MSRTLLAGLMAGTLLSGFAAPARAAPTSVDGFIGDILGDAPDSATIARRCDAYVSEIDRQLAALEGETGRATIDTTLQRYDDLSNLIAAASGESTLYREVMADDARRGAGAQCEVRMSAAANKLGLSRPVYDRLTAIDATGADAATKLYLTRTLAAFERAGVSRPPEERARIQAMQDRIAELETAFVKNIADGRKTVEADPAELAGLPADFIAAHKPGASGKVVISTDTPDYVPVLTYSTSEPLRRRLYTAYMTRAYPANDAVLREMLDTRQRLATTLGRKDFATLVLENKMLDAPAKVEGLLAEMATVARPAGTRDYAKKLAVAKLSQPGVTAIDPWSNAFISQQVERREYAYDRQALRQYFSYNEVRDGILRLSEDLFGIDIRPWTTATWDPSVESYQVYDQGKLIGRFYFDSHPRPGKYNHANAVGLRSGVAGRSIPVGALVMNLPAGDHATGLMEHSDVVTFLHEFGHMLHGIFGAQGQRWSGQSGVATEWDFVEAPSQMLEEWVYDYDTLATFAKNAGGATIPRDLVEKLNRARYFDLGMGDMRQLALSNISLRLHQAPAPVDLAGEVRRLDAAYSMIELPEFTQFQDSFGHLSGYSAVYYTYRWSKVIADDLFTAFRQNGLRDRATAQRYRTLVLAPGGTKPAAQLVKDFLGRPVSLDAYKAELAKNL